MDITIKFKASPMFYNYFNKGHDEHLLKSEREQVNRFMNSMSDRVKDTSPDIYIVVPAEGDATDYGVCEITGVECNRLEYTIAKK